MSCMIRRAGLNKYLVAGLILLALSGFLFFRLSSKTEPFNQWWFSKFSVRDYHFGEFFYMTWRTVITISWEASDPVLIGITYASSALDYQSNKGPLVLLTGVVGNKALLSYSAPQDGDYELVLQSTEPPSKGLGISGALTMSYPTRPMLWGPLGALGLTAAIIGASRFLRD